MRGVPDCPDCGSQMQLVPNGGTLLWWRCPWAVDGAAVKDSASVEKFKSFASLKVSVPIIRCGRTTEVRRGPMSGHFLGSSDMDHRRRGSA